MTRTLLLADDSVVIQKLVGLSFANEAIELITTDNGEDAITRAREVRPDLVLADVVMPGKSGYEVCEAIKQDPELAHVPVLLLTGTFEAFDEERAAAMGSDGHITKPFEAQVLVERVNELLERGSAEASPAPSPDGPAPAAGSEDSYEFFDDDPAPITAAPIPSIGSTPAADPGAATEAVPAVDQDFAFGSSSAAAPESSLSAGRLSEPEAGGDRTVAMMPADAAALSQSKSEGSLEFDDLGATVLAPEDAAPAPEADPLAGDDLGATMLVDDPFGDNEPDLSFRDEPLSADEDLLDLDAVEASAPVIGNPGDTLLADDLFGDSNPLAELAEPLEAPDITPAAPMEPAEFDEAAPLIDSDSAAGIMSLESEAEAGEFEDLPVGEPLSEAPSFEAPASDALAAADAPAELLSPEPLAIADEAEPALIASEPIADEPPAVELPVEQTPNTAPLDTPTDAFAVATSEGPALEALQTASSVPDLSPMLRERLHESLEKIAWEAFADLSDQIVKQVLQRVEAVAWEVIPQMAEALIQEEIRRMKGGEED
jgi:CheY-like chemotaxis protein